MMPAKQWFHPQSRFEFQEAINYSTLLKKKQQKKLLVDDLSALAAFCVCDGVSVII